MVKCLNCDNRALFNYKNENERIYCKDHKKDGMIDFDDKSQICIFSTCIKKASFNIETEKKALYCSDHKEDNMINVKGKKCLKCSKLASFNYEGLKTAIYCSEHALENMVSVSIIQCIIKNCKEHAYYNFKNETKRLYCRNHRDIKMIDLTHRDKICIALDCTIQAHFNYENETVGIYCTSHKLDNMVDVISKKCIFNNCKTICNYNYAHEKSPLYCSIHALENMVNLYRKECIYPNCKTIPSFNYIGLKERLYCSQHALEDMVSFSKKCIYESGCNIVPKYNYKNEKIPLYCTSHKKDDMIYLHPYYCKEENCYKYPSFNYEGFGAKYCKKHIKEDMINVVDKICLDCNTIASYNYPEFTERIYCTSHKKNGMIDLYGLNCKSNFCNLRINKKINRYNGYCLQCFAHLFPDEPIVKNYMTKEKAVGEFILNNFPDYTWLVNQVIPDGCSKKKPDLLLDLGSHLICIEIDENQHILYDSICEENRMNSISEDVHFRNIIFIRFNPDDYIDKDDNKIKSPWIYYKTKIMITPENEIIWNNRLNKLKNSIQYYIDNNIDKPIEIIKLFYDENDN